MLLLLLLLLRMSRIWCRTAREATESWALPPPLLLLLLLPSPLGRPAAVLFREKECMCGVWDCEGRREGGRGDA